MPLISWDLLRNNDTLNLPLQVHRFPSPIRKWNMAPLMPQQSFQYFASFRFIRNHLSSGNKDKFVTLPDTSFFTFCSITLMALVETCIYFSSTLKKSWEEKVRRKDRVNVTFAATFYTRGCSFTQFEFFIVTFRWSYSICLSVMTSSNIWAKSPWWFFLTWYIFSTKKHVANSIKIESLHFQSVPWNL